MQNEPKHIIDIPQMKSYRSNSENFDSNKFEHQCACCGRGIKEPSYFINTIYGGMMYPANDNNEYNDAWEMAVGNDCIKKIPSKYLITTGA